MARPEKYRLGERLGGGGMAEVFLGSMSGAEGFQRHVAIKRVLPGFSDNPQFTQMFIAEAQISAQLQHANIVSVLDFDRDAENRMFLVMELVEGKDLERLMASGPLPRPVIIYVITEILRGLSHAHDLPVGAGLRGIVHRDVSPHNVLLSWEGAVKISDFGIAKVKQTSEATASVLIKGKPAYMSPEQANGESLDGRSDLFAVGVILWEMLVGKRLFVGEDMRATLAAVLFGEIPRVRQVDSEIPKDLDRVVAKLLERDLKARYATAADVIDDLRQCVDAPTSGAELLKRTLAERFPTETAVANLSTIAVEASEQPAEASRQPWARIRRPGRRRTRVLIVSGALLAVLTGVLLIALGSSHPPIRLPGIGAKPASIENTQPSASGAALDTGGDDFSQGVVVLSPEERKHIEDLEVATETRIERNLGSAHDLQANYFNAVTMNCELGNKQRVNTYFAKLTDPQFRQSAIVICKSYGFDLGTASEQKAAAEKVADDQFSWGFRTNPPLSAEYRKRYEEMEAVTEATIERNDGSASDLQSSYLTAVSMNCGLGNPQKVNMYFAKLTDQELRRQAIIICQSWGFDLRTKADAH